MSESAAVDVVGWIMDVCPLGPEGEETVRHLP